MLKSLRYYAGFVLITLPLVGFLKLLPFCGKLAIRVTRFVVSGLLGRRVGNLAGARMANACAGLMIRGYWTSIWAPYGRQVATHETQMMLLEMYLEDALADGTVRVVRVPAEAPAPQTDQPADPT
jgi:hypothetical protein